MSPFFDNREDDYLRWTEEHQHDGYIVNVGGGFAPKVHLARRRCVTGPGRSNYTTHEYKKDCATDLNELEAKYGAALTYCGLCFRGGRRPAPGRVAPRVEPTTASSQRAERIVEKLIAVYREQTVPEMVREFEGWGFPAHALRDQWELLYVFLVLAAYDRQPYTRAGGYERIWADEPGSLRRVLGDKGLLDPHEITAAKVEAIEPALADARYGGLSLQTDRGAGSTQGTLYARTLKEVGTAVLGLHSRVLNAKSGADAEVLFRLFDDIHGIGPTIASKLCKYLLRELRLGDVPPSQLARCAQPILGEYHNSDGYRKLALSFGEGTMGEVLESLAQSADPYAIDAIFFINRFLGGDFVGFLGG